MRGGLGTEEIGLLENRLSAEQLDVLVYNLYNFHHSIMLDEPGDRELESLCILLSDLIGTGSYANGSHVYRMDR